MGNDQPSDYDIGQYNPDSYAQDEDVQTEQKTKESFCEYCKKITKLGKFDGSWWCNRCGSQNKKLNEEFDTGTSGSLDPSLFDQHDTTRISVTGPRTTVSGKLGKLQKNMTTSLEKQLLWNRALSEEILKRFGYEEPDQTTENTGGIFALREQFFYLYRKTGLLKLQRGRSALANIVAVLIISFRIQEIKYNFNELLSKIEDPNYLSDEEILSPPEIEAFMKSHFVNDPNFIRNKIWTAEKLIISSLFGKSKCTQNKFHNNQQENAQFIRCPRLNAQNIPLKNSKDEINSLLSTLDSLGLEFSFYPVLDKANQIYEKAEKKGLLSGLKPETTASAIILLSINSISELTISEICEYIPTSETTIKRASQTINESLDLRIQIKSG